jgi:hypothetical protein
MVTLPAFFATNYELPPRLQYRGTLLPNERVELWVWFGAPRSFDVDLQVQRRRIDGTWTTVSSNRRRANTHEAFVKVSHVFQAQAGQWRVLIIPLGATAAEETARWLFDVAGNACGDAFEDFGEECDDGVANSDRSPNACRTTCMVAACGDGIRGAVRRWGGATQRDV